MFELAAIPLAGAVQRSLDSAPAPPKAQVVTKVADDLRVVADESRLEQVVTNLLTNAYRDGGPTIVLEAHAEGDEVVLIVSDDGSGVPPDLLADLFEPFSRGTDAPDVGGSGIGLALSRRLVETFGGRLEYEPGDPGARFVCRLQAA